MKAWLCETLEGIGAMHWREMPTPEPQPGEVRVAVHAASLNFPDLLIVEGKYQFKPPLPFVPGAEFSGTVDAVGEGVTHLRVGMPVAAIAGTGGFATHACVKAAQVMPLPPGFALDDAAAFAFTYGTSHHALMDRAALQIAKAAGARVIAAASTDEKCDLCKQLGADATLNYTTTPVREALKALTDGRGPDVVYDPVGGDLAEPVFRSIAWRGRYLVVGFAQGGIPALPWNLALLKGASLVGVFWGEFIRREPQASAAALKQLAQWYGAGLIKPVIDQRLPMSELPAAYARMGSRQVRGKVVLVND